MLDKQKLQLFVWPMTLELRQKTRHLWIRKGLYFVKKHPDFLTNYWIKRLAKQVPNEIEIYKRFEEMANNGVIFPKIVVPLSKATLAKNVVGAAIKWISSGLKVTPEEMIEERKQICMSCEFWDAQAMNGTGRCLKCGCSTWAKIRLASESCPIDKWKAVV